MSTSETAAPVASAPVDAAPVTSAPVDAAPVASAPVDPAPVTSAPVDAAPVTSAPVDVAPVVSAPVEVSGPVGVSAPDEIIHERPANRAILLLTTSHFLIDLCQGMVPALLPFMVIDNGLTYGAGAGLVFAVSALSSLVQPLFGQLADKRPWAWILPVSVLGTSIAIATGAVSTFYPLIFVMFSIAGLGIAAFHPQAARFVHLVGRKGQTTSMSMFSVGGAIGFATAPLFVKTFMGQMGRTGSWLVLIPAVLIGAWLFLTFCQADSPHLSHRVNEKHRALRADNWNAFIQLSVTTLCRSIVFFGLNTFLALYWMQRWSVTPERGVDMLFLYLSSGIVGTLLGGWLADRIGRRVTVRISFGLSVILLPLLFWAPNEFIARNVLALLGLTTFLCASVIIVLGQEYLPNRIGFASGITIGLAVSVGGMTAPLLGLLADWRGLGLVMTILEMILIIGAVQAFILPDPRRTVLAT